MIAGLTVYAWFCLSAVLLVIVMTVAAVVEAFQNRRPR